MGRSSVRIGIIAIMSHNIAYSTADKADVLAYLGSNGNLTADQRRRLAASACPPTYCPTTTSTVDSPATSLTSPTR
jgi:hypothetical protein